MTLAKNVRLLAVRHSLRMSQADLARAIRQAGERVGEPNGCTYRMIQRWEDGTQPRGAYVKAIEAATGQPAEALGFRADERYGVNNDLLGLPGVGFPPPPKPGDHIEPLTGIWRSWYEYESSGRGAVFTSSHYCLAVQQAAHLQVRSFPGTASGRLLMDLTVNGQAVTGGWTEETEPGGYYQGAVYHGAIQLLLDLSGRKMTGKWAGFGREYDVNTGPWTLELVTHDTSPESQERYNRPVESAG